MRFHFNNIASKHNIQTRRFVSAVEDKGTKNEVLKAWLVVRGHRGKRIYELVGNVSVAKQKTKKLLVKIVAILSFRVSSTDLTHSYTKSAENVLREAFVEPPKECFLNLEQHRKLYKRLYGLKDVTYSEKWMGKIIQKLLQEKLGVKKGISNTALAKKISMNALTGMCILYLDDRFLL